MSDAAPRYALRPPGHWLDGTARRGIRRTTLRTCSRLLDAYPVPVPDMRPSGRNMRSIGSPLLPSDTALVRSGPLGYCFTGRQVAGLNLVSGQGHRFPGVFTQLPHIPRSAARRAIATSHHADGCAPFRWSFRTAFVIRLFNLRRWSPRPSRYAGTANPRATAFRRSSAVNGLNTTGTLAVAKNPA